MCTHDASFVLCMLAACSYIQIHCSLQHIVDRDLKQTKDGVRVTPLHSFFSPQLLHRLPLEIFTSASLNCYIF